MHVRTYDGYIWFSRKIYALRVVLKQEAKCSHLRPPRKRWSDASRRTRPSSSSPPSAIFPLSDMSPTAIFVSFLFDRLVVVVTQTGKGFSSSIGRRGHFEKRFYTKKCRSQTKMNFKKIALNWLDTFLAISYDSEEREKARKIGSWLDVEKIFWSNLLQAELAETTNAFLPFRCSQPTNKQVFFSHLQRGVCANSHHASGSWGQPNVPSPNS